MRLLFDVEIEGGAPRAEALAIGAAARPPAIGAVLEACDAAGRIWRGRVTRVAPACDEGAWRRIGVVIRTFAPGERVRRD